jgi:hypothetical protein
MQKEKWINTDRGGHITLTKVQEDLEHSQRSQGIHKCSKFKYLKSYLKCIMCIDLVIIFPMTQTVFQSSSYAKVMSRSKFKVKTEKKKVKGNDDFNMVKGHVSSDTWHPTIQHMRWKTSWHMAWHIQSTVSWHLKWSNGSSTRGTCLANERLPRNGFIGKILCSPGESTP